MLRLASLQYRWLRTENRGKNDRICVLATVVHKSRTGAFEFVAERQTSRLGPIDDNLPPLPGSRRTPSPGLHQK